MRFDIVTLFPGYFASPLGESLVGRAVEAGILDVHLVDLRDFSGDPHRKVDDEPYGGGPGMVLTAPPVFASVEALREEPGAPPPHVVFLSPQGRRFDVSLAKELAGRPRVALLCGRYEGIDERVRTAGLFDEEISLGDFVLSGGEVAALAILEAVSRYLPGVVQDAASVSADSFEDGLLDHPHYSRPRTFHGLDVPDVLFSGHHENIRKWRREEQLAATLARRPDLLRTAPLDDEEKALLERLAGERRSP
jgi:tRNA (guanine37-N1)-methyltransferase